MPPPRKLDLIPKDLLDWLKEELMENGHANYLHVTERLNARLEERGEELRIGKSAVGAFGIEHKEMLKVQEEASAWAATWMDDAGLEEEAKRHSVLFQMVTTLAFKVMKSQMTKEGDEIDPKELHFLGRMLKDVMSSSGIREQSIANYVKEKTAKLDAAVADGSIDEIAARKAREILGFG